MSNEEEPNLRLFFRPFLTTSEGMDIHLGFSGIKECRVGFGRRKPQRAVHVGVRAKCTMRKGPKKSLTTGSFAPADEMTRMESQVNGMFLMRRHFGPGIPPWAGEGPKSAATGVMDDGGSVASGIRRLPGSLEQRHLWKLIILLR